MQYAQQPPVQYAQPQYMQQPMQYGQPVYQQQVPASQYFQQPPMQPQMQYAPQFAQPQYQQPQQVFVNNAPVASMPANVSQTGISRDQMRQDAANYLVRNQNMDAIAKRMVLECAGNVQNFQTGLFDKHVTRLMSLTDYIWGSGRHNGDINAVYNQAIEENYNILWVYMIMQDYNRWIQDPTIAHKAQLINQLAALAKQREAELSQAGMLENNAPMNVPAQMTPGYQHRPQTRIQGVNANDLAPSHQMNQPALSRIPDNGNSSRYGISFDDIGTVSGYRSGANQDDTNTATTYSDDNRYGTPMMDPTTAKPVTSPVQAQSEPAPSSLPLKQPHQVHKESKTYTSFNSDADDAFEQLAEMLRQEQKAEAMSMTDALEEDEVRFLTRKEVKQAQRQGVRFERPFYWPLNPCPFKFYLHAVLTKRGTIRQYLTKVEDKDKMKYSEHADILGDLRNDPSLKLETPEVLKAFDFTTQGGVVHDRWQDAPINLEINLEKANNAETEEKKEELMKKAYDQFVEDVKREDQEYHDGTLDWKRQNPERSEDGFGPSEIELPDDKRITNETRSRSKHHVNKSPMYDKEFFKNALPDAMTMQYMREAIQERKPHVTTEVKVADVEVVEPIYVANHYTEKEEIEEILQPLYWALNEDTKTPLNLADVRNALRDARDNPKVPRVLYDRLVRQATDLVNESLYAIFGLGTTIDDFVEDYDDLVDYIYSLDVEEYPNFETGYRSLALNVIQGMITLNRDDEDEDESADNPNVRAIMSKRHYTHVQLPTSAKANGITFEGLEYIDYANNSSLYVLISDIYTKSVSRRESARGDGNPPVIGLYLSFGDGVTFKLLPYLAKDIHVDDVDNDDFTLKAFSLTRVKSL